MAVAGDEGMVCITRTRARCRSRTVVIKQKCLTPLTGQNYGQQNLTEKEEKSQSYNCYTEDNAKICCETCNKYRNDANVGCEYGDKHHSCASLISSAADSHNCYGKNAGTCCESCKKYYNATNVGCEYGDKSSDCASLITSRVDTPYCYAGNNADLCCGACAKFYDPAHKGCEYGDKLNGCKSTKCSVYNDESRRGCCYSCRSTVVVG